MKKILQCFIGLVLIFVIIVNLTLIIKSEFGNEKIPDFMGYTPFIVATGSMDPVLKVNDLIVVKKTNAQNLMVGDIISYYDKENEIVITHRISKVEEQEGTKIFTAKGDNNNIEDKTVITEDLIQGKYLMSIPFIGRIANYTATPKGFTVVVSIIILVYIIIDTIGRLFDNMRKQKKN